MPAHQQHSAVQDEALLPSDFKSPLCGCADDIGTCAEVYFCRCVTAGRIRAANEGRPDTVDTLWCCLGLCFPLCADFVLRGQTRARYNLQGNACGDFFTALCCGACSLCQLANEHNRRGTYTGGLCCAPSLGPRQVEMGDAHSMDVVHSSQ